MRARPKDYLEETPPFTELLTQFCVSHLFQDSGYRKTGLSHFSHSDQGFLYNQVPVY